MYGKFDETTFDYNNIILEMKIDGKAIFMFDIQKNYEISRKLASGGMVLLKNEDKILPFKKTDRIGVVGKDCLDLISGGGGSAAVMTEYKKSLKDGLCEKSEEKKFLFFVTGSERTPPGGLARLKFTIAKHGGDDHLPSASTCFNLLLLPPYTNKNDLEEKLTFALNNTKGFGLV